MAADLKALDPDLKQAALELMQACTDAGLQPTITSTLRSFREQQFLWNRYVNGLSALPAAPPLHSAHEYGWAFDMVVSPRTDQSAVGRAWQSQWGGTWGGARDPVHFELPGASAQAYALGEQASAGQPSSLPSNTEDHVRSQLGSTSTWDQALELLSFVGGSVSLAVELAYVVLSKAEATRVRDTLRSLIGPAAFDSAMSAAGIPP